MEVYLILNLAFWFALVNVQFLGRLFRAAPLGSFVFLGLSNVSLNISKMVQILNVLAKHILSFFFFLPLVTNRGVSSHWFLWSIETENHKTENHKLLLSDDDECVLILTLKQAGVLVEWIMFTHLFCSASSLIIPASVRVRWENQGFQVSLRSGNTHCNPIVSQGLCALNPCVYI